METHGFPWFSNDHLSPDSKTNENRMNTNSCPMVVQWSFIIKNWLKTVPTQFQISSRFGNNENHVFSYGFPTIFVIENWLKPVLKHVQISARHWKQWNINGKPMDFRMVSNDHVIKNWLTSVPKQFQTNARFENNENQGTPDGFSNSFPMIICHSELIKISSNIVPNQFQIRKQWKLRDTRWVFR